MGRLVPNTATLTRVSRLEEVGLSRFYRVVSIGSDPGLPALEASVPSGFVAASSAVQTRGPAVVRSGLRPDRGASTGIAEQPKLALVASIVREVEANFLLSRKHTFTGRIPWRKRPEADLEVPVRRWP